MRSTKSFAAKTPARASQPPPAQIVPRYRGSLSLYWRKVFWIAWTVWDDWAAQVQPHRSGRSTPTNLASRWTAGGFLEFRFPDDTRSDRTSSSRWKTRTRTSDEDCCWSGGWQWSMEEKMIPTNASSCSMDIRRNISWICLCVSREGYLDYGEPFLVLICSLFFNSLNFDCMLWILYNTNTRNTNTGNPLSTCPKSNSHTAVNSQTFSAYPFPWLFPGTWEPFWYFLLYSSSLRGTWRSFRLTKSPYTIPVPCAR